VSCLTLKLSKQRAKLSTVLSILLINREFSKKFVPRTTCLGQREGAVQGGSSRSQVAGPGKSVSKRSVEKDLKAESSCRGERS